MKSKNKILFVAAISGLVCLVILLAFIIARGEASNGIIIVAGLAGISVGVFSFRYPEFGFYSCLLFSFIAFDLNRLVYSGLAFISLIDLLILVTFLGIIAKKLITKEQFWKNSHHPIVFAYGIYAFYTLLQVVNPNAVSVSVSVTIVRKFFNLILILYCAIEIFKDTAAIQRFFRIWMMAAFGCALYGCYQEWVGYPAYEYNYIMSDVRLIGLYTLPTGEIRKFSSLSDPRNFGLLMAACALISIVLFMHASRTIGHKVQYVIYFIFFALAMSYSGTRTAYFMLVMGMFLYVMMTILNRTTLIFTGVAAMGLVFLLYGPIYGNSTINRIRSTFDFEKDASFNVRDLNRHRIQPYIYSHPFGGGLGTTGDNYMAANASHPLAGFPPDSGYLLTALEAGWIGLAIQMTLYFLILLQGVRIFYRTNTTDRPLVLTAVVCLFSYMVAQYAQVSIGQPPGLFLFYSSIAVIITIGNRQRTDMR